MTSSCDGCVGIDFYPGFSCATCGRKWEAGAMSMPTQEALEISMLREQLDVAREKCEALRLVAEATAAREDAAVEKIKELWAKVCHLGGGAS